MINLFRNCFKISLYILTPFKYSKKGLQIPVFYPFLQGFAHRQNQDSK